MTRSTLIVFGAGASCDPFAPTVQAAVEGKGGFSEEARVRSRALRLEKHIPPLTNGLVLALQAQGAGCTSILQQIAQTQAQAVSQDAPFNFEATLRAMHTAFGGAQRGEFVELRNALANRMAEADEIGRSVDTLYTTIFSLVRYSGRGLRKVVAVSLNYDRLAEYAIGKRSPFGSFDEYTGRDDNIALYQPHGSSAWSLYDKSDSLHQQMLESSPKCHPRGGDAQNEHIVFGRRKELDTAALAIPMSGDADGKTAWSRRHERALRDDLASVDEVIVVGWRGADPHIVDFVKRELGDIAAAHLVGYLAEDAVEMRSNLADWFGEGTAIEEISGGFRKYLTDPSSKFHLLAPVVTA